MIWPYGMENYNNMCIHVLIYSHQRVMSLFRPKEPEIKGIASRQADINIFTVASGLLYEVSRMGFHKAIFSTAPQRFASIMILSVLRNTNSTVKFWFIENFLSPSFLVSLLFVFYPRA